ncbi:hypothetical protein [Actinophytocola sediminis]
MAAPVYTYQLADLRSGRILEDFTPTAVRFTKPLNAAGRFDCSWKLGEKTTRLDPYDLTMPARRVIYAYRDSRPQWGGIIWTRSYDSTSQTVTLGAGEFWTYFDHRKVLPLLPADPDLSTVAGLSVTYDNTDQNEIARQLVALAQTHTGGDIGIRLDDTESFFLRDRTYNGYDLADVGESLRQLCNVIGGPDLVFDIAPNPAGGPPLRVLRLGTPWLGQQGSAHVWEVGGNVTSYTWPSDGSSMATRAFAVGEGVDLGLPIAVHEDTTKYAQGFPLLEVEHNYGSAEGAATLFGHAEADQQTARMPVVLPKIVVRGDVAPTAADVSRGDDGQLVVPADPFHRTGFTGPVRVVEIAYAPSVSAERITLTLAPLLDDTA